MNKISDSGTTDINKKDARIRVQELRDLIERANKAYYEEAKPFISDREFDEALKEKPTMKKQNHLFPTGNLMKH